MAKITNTSAPRKVLVVAIEVEYDDWVKYNSENVPDDKKQEVWNQLLDTAENVIKLGDCSNTICHIHWESPDDGYMDTIIESKTDEAMSDLDIEPK